MKYIFELNHPKHYYQFKYIIDILQKKGHSILILARDKDVLLTVLDEEHVPYTIFGDHKDSISGKVFSSFSIFLNYYRIVRDFKPDVIVSKASLYGTLVSRISKCRSVIFPDSEVVKLTNRVVAPLASMIVTPRSFRLDYGSKHHRIDGLFEDCYLAPSVKTIDGDYPTKVGLNRPYAILRFVGWTANHDINKSGFSFDEKMRLVCELGKFMSVYISSEKDLPNELKPFHLFTPPADIHDVLANADLYIGDSQTMATEAALLGTPSIRSNSFVGDNDMSNFVMLEKQFGLLLNIKDFDTVLSKAIDFAKHPRKQEWQNKRDEYYRRVGDINAAIVDLIETV